MIDPQPKKSDLGVRAASALVMVAVAGGAIWAGGLAFSLFLLALAGVLLWEWWGLVAKIAKTRVGLIGAMLLGAAYIVWSLNVGYWLWVKHHANSSAAFLFIVTAAMVVAVDVGAYFTGRALGGPKIAPSISPSKTWSGLLGGIIGASIVVLAAVGWDAEPQSGTIRLVAVVFAMAVAVIAQAGDFLESWMKRRAGVKDSGHLIPGHGGLLDRLDGHLMVFAMLPFIVFVLFGIVG